MFRYCDDQERRVHTWAHVRPRKGTSKRLSCSSSPFVFTIFVRSDFLYRHGCIRPCCVRPIVSAMILLTLVCCSLACFGMFVDQILFALRFVRHGCFRPGFVRPVVHSVYPHCCSPPSFLFALAFARSVFVRLVCCSP